MKKIFGLEKNIFLLGVISFFNDFSSEMILSVFPAFFTSVLHAGAASLGLVEGIAEAGANFIKIYSGRLSDKIQKRKPFIVLGYLLSVATRPIYPFVSTILGVIGLRVTDRIGKGLRDSPRDAIISISSPKEDLGKSFGYHRAMDTIGAILGPFLVYCILRKFPFAFDKVFLTSFVIGILAVIATIFVTDVTARIKDGKLILPSISLFPNNFKLYLLALFILSIGSLPIAVMLLKTQSIGMTIASIPLFYMFYSLSYATFSFIGGKWSDKVGQKKVIIIGNLMLIAGYLVLEFSYSVPSLILGFLFLGVFPAFTDGVVRSYTAILTNEENRGGAYGLVNAVSGFGLLVAGIFGGYTWQNYGSNVAFSIGTLFVVLGLIVFSFVQNKQEISQ